MMLPAHLVRLTCIDDDAQGQPLEVLWQKEVDREVLRGEPWGGVLGNLGTLHLALAG